MPKPRHGNKEAKKPKQAPAHPVVPAGTLPALAVQPAERGRKR